MEDSFLFQGFLMFLLIMIIDHSASCLQFHFPFICSCRSAGCRVKISLEPFVGIMGSPALLSVHRCQPVPQPDSKCLIYLLSFPELFQLFAWVFYTSPFPQVRDGIALLNVKQATPWYSGKNIKYVVQKMGREYCNTLLSLTSLKEKHWSGNYISPPLISPT